METVIGLYKTECIRPGPFHSQPLKTIADIEYATMAWVDWFGYAGDPGAIDDFTPIAVEQFHYAHRTALTEVGGSTT